jgi:V8-like Glu-specific endopeptidase
VCAGKGPLEKRRNGLTVETELRDITAEDLLKRLSDLENYPHDALAPYEEYKLDEKTYYFTPGGFLYRKDTATGALGGYFCGYLTDEVWHYRSDDG